MDQQPKKRIILYWIYHYLNARHSEGTIVQQALIKLKGTKFMNDEKKGIHVLKVVSTLDAMQQAIPH